MCFFNKLVRGNIFVCVIENFECEKVFIFMLKVLTGQINASRCGIGITLCGGADWRLVNNAMNSIVLW